MSPGRPTWDAGESDSESVRLLRACETLLSHDAWALSHWWARGAAHLARQAMESLLDEYWTMQRPAVAGVPVRARFLGLHAFTADAEAIHDGYSTWSQLSRACHYHPYELAPTRAEVHAWVNDASRFCTWLRALGRDAG